LTGYLEQKKSASQPLYNPAYRLVASTPQMAQDGLCGGVILPALDLGVQQDGDIFIW